jgi:hypothetical protein
MNFYEISLAIHQGKKVRRTDWGSNTWIRLIDLYLDEEFSIMEHEPCEGTWIPFMIYKRWDGAISPWMPLGEDISANDWVEIT